MRWENTATIASSSQTVWQMTIDVASWPSLMPTITSVERLDSGPMRIGSTARIKQPGQSPAVWTVTKLVEGREFAWQTKRMGMTMVGLHIVEDLGGQCRNTLILDVTGRGSKVFALLFGALMRKTLAVENESFRKHAERAAAQR